MPVVRPCAICDGPGEGCFFGVFSCRCCAAFFRRSVRECRQYQCRGTGNCSINEAGMRNSCRACRLQRCLQNGMSMTAGGGKTSAKDLNKRSRVGDHRRSQKADYYDEQLGTSADPLPPIHDHPMPPSSYAVGLQELTAAQVSPPFSQSATISGQFAKTAAKFMEQLTTLCAQYFGRDILLGNFEQRLTYTDCIKLDNLSAPIYLEFVRTHFPELDSLQKGQKAELLNNFFNRYGFVLSYELTLAQLRKRPPPDGTLEKFYLFPNCIMDGSDNCDYFFSDIIELGREEQRRMGKAFQKDSIHFLQNRYMPLAISPLEFAALTGILFWNTVKKTVEMPRFNTQLEALFLELHQLIGQQQLQKANKPNPSTFSISRFGYLMTLLGDLTNMADKDLKDVYTMCNLFMDPSSTRDYTNFWENLV